MGEFLQTSSDPIIQKTYAETLQNPSEHIGVVDNLGYKEYDYFPGGFSYLVFTEERNPFDQETEPAWSFAIAIADEDNPAQTFANVRVQLNNEGDIYTGSNDFLPGFDQISMEDIDRVSDTFFNIPEEMQALPLINVPGETFLEPPTLRRAYEGYLQVATVMGVVMLIAPHPLPQKEDVDTSPAPNIPSPNNPLL